MRPSHIRRTIALAAGVSATVLAGGLAVMHSPQVTGERSSDVERVAEQYRGRYQLRLDEARDLLAKAPAAERSVAV